MSAIRSSARLSAPHVEAVLADDSQPAALAAAFDDSDRLFLLTPGGAGQAATERRLVDSAIIDTRDIAAVAAAALLEDRHAGQTYMLTGPGALSYAEVAQKLTRLLSIAVLYMPLSDEGDRAVLLANGLPTTRRQHDRTVRFYRAENAVATTDLVEGATGHTASVSSMRSVAYFRRSACTSQVNTA